MLKGIKILEFQGLAPSVFCGMYFADQGADVILISRPQPAPFSIPIHKNIMNRNKKNIILSLKDNIDKQILIDLIKISDIIIDPYRPGVLEKQNLGPTHLQKINPQIILLRVTGYGQTGKMSLMPGHDLNYIATSGILPIINGKSQKYEFPANYLADFVSASFGILDTLAALKNRQFSKVGAVVDCSLAGGCAYLADVVTKDEELKVVLDKKNIQYFEKHQKRFLVTKTNKQASIQQINKIVQKMYKDQQEYFTNEMVEIAQILPIKDIKQSKLLNPFTLGPFKQVKNIFPKRDQHRNQILNLIKLRAKL